MRRAIAATMAGMTLMAWGGISEAARPQRHPQVAQGLGVDLPKDKPAVLTADEMSMDQDLGITTARGNVEVTLADHTLIADTLSYNSRTDVLTASGNVSLLEPDGNVLFADYFEVTGDLRDGIIKNIRLLLPDGSRVAANGGRRSGGNILELRKAVYSPCKPCEEDPSRAPLWQLKAFTVTHDKQRRIVEYEDAWLELAGIPVAYTPYIRHPDPTVDRETGFLAPSFGGDSEMGSILRTPFYWNIAPEQDATFTPILTTEEGVAGAAEYRRRFTNGEGQALGSLAYDSDGDVLGHIDAQGEWHHTPTWRSNLQVQRTTHDTYQRRYGFGSEQTLETHGRLEGFRHRNYASANTYLYQSLRAGEEEGEIPIVAPYLNFNHVGEPDRAGGHTFLNASALATTRTSGNDTRRLSAETGWTLPKVFQSGDVVTSSVSVSGDVYHYQGLSVDNGTREKSGVSGRIWPEASTTWRKPFVKPDDRISFMVEPIAMAAISPYGGNAETIPNEDSVSFDFDDTNLFRENRFAGVDKVEGGPRFSYGIKSGVQGFNGGHSSFFVGQSYRLRKDSRFAEGSGLEDNLSDIVTRAQISPGKYVDAVWRGLLDNKNLEPKRSELQLNVGPEALQASANYLLVDRVEGSPYAGREELSASLSAQIDRFWSADATMITDMTDGGDLRSVSLGFAYEDECFIFDTSLRRTFFEDRDLRPSDSILFTVTFKTLGAVSTQSSVN
ncbi:MAG: LPS-assembly protein LptD [Rhodospirillales bacterium]